MSERKKTVIAIVGPTCTGKTALAVEIARELNGEIIACDSRTVYRHMDVGTAKPTMEERQGITHHMFDVVEPDENYTAAQYKNEAEQEMAKLFEQGKTPIVCGGTGFYARALLEGLAIPEVAPQPELRRELRQIAEQEGNAALHERLKVVDAITAARLNVNDIFRIVRALEVSLVKGSPFSELVDRKELPFTVVWIGLTVSDRSHLRERIRERFAEQLRAGLIEETQSLYTKFGAVRSLTNSVNYREFLQCFDGRLTYDEACEQCLQHNNQLARRQLIWFRANREMNWFEVDLLERKSLLQKILLLARERQHR